DLVAMVGIARIGPPDVRADRAAPAERVFCLVAEIVEGGRRLLALRAVWKAREGGSVGPAADHLRGQTPGNAAALVAAHEVAKADDVLRELAEHHVGAGVAR